MEHEIETRGPLLGPNGELREPGWARRPLLDYDRRAVKSPRWRLKEWDYYCAIAGEYGVAFTVADNGYMGMLSATVLDFRVGVEVTETVMTPFPMGRTGLPPSSGQGVTVAKSGNVSLRFEAKDGVRRLEVNWPGFGVSSGGKAARLFGMPGCPARPEGSATVDGAVGLKADLVLTERAEGESMVIATPFRRPRRGFYYNQKINCQATAGRVRVGTHDIVFEPGRAFAVLDWGRGVWPWRNNWLWGSASGFARVEGSAAVSAFGFNIGYGFGDTSAASENMVFLDGKAHKLGALTIDFDEGDFLEPWRVRSEDGRLELSMRTVLDRAASTDFVLLASIQHQVFGYWSGTVLLEDGRRIVVKDLLGFCEKVRNRW